MKYGDGENKKEIERNIMCVHAYLLTISKMAHTFLRFIAPAVYRSRSPKCSMVRVSRPCEGWYEFDVALYDILTSIQTRLISQATHHHRYYKLRMHI